MLLARRNFEQEDPTRGAEVVGWGKVKIYGKTLEN